MKLSIIILKCEKLGQEPQKSYSGKQLLIFIATDVATMILTELTEEIRPLTRSEKLQLIEAISKMLLEEENAQDGLDPTITYPLFTPLHQERAASQLQQFLEQRGNPF